MSTDIMKQLEKRLQPKIEKALKNTALELTDELRKCITKDVYDRNKDIISMRMLSSIKTANCSIKSTNSGASGKISVNKDVFKNLKDENGNSIDIEIDDSLFENFKEYCNKNFEKLFKVEMKKLGIPIK